MVTKKRIERIINLLDNLRGPKSIQKSKSAIYPFSNLLNSTFGENTYHHFYNEVMYGTPYRTEEFMTKSIEYLHHVTQVIDDENISLRKEKL